VLSVQTWQGVHPQQSAQPLPSGVWFETDQPAGLSPSQAHTVMTPPSHGLAPPLPACPPPPPAPLPPVLVPVVLPPVLVPVVLPPVLVLPAVPPPPCVVDEAPPLPFASPGELMAEQLGANASGATSAHATPPQARSLMVPILSLL
jgi:hypothetical protein